MRVLNRFGRAINKSNNQLRFVSAIQQPITTTSILSSVPVNIIATNATKQELMKKFDLQYYRLDYQGALETVNRLIEVSDKESDESISRYYYQRGLILNKMGNINEGIQDMINAFSNTTSVLNIDPQKRIQAYEVIVSYYMKLQEYKKALEWQDIVIHFAQTNKLVTHQHFDTRSEILSRIGKIGEAIDDLHRSTDIQLEDNGSVMKSRIYMMSLLQYEQCMTKKRYKQALMYIEEAIALSDTLQLDLIFKKVQVMEKLGLLKGAIQYLQTLLNTTPPSQLFKLKVHIHRKLAELKLTSELFEDALDHIEIIVQTYSSSSNNQLSKDFWKDLEHMKTTIKNAKKNSL
jgi:tetratricopeptide (TPR) repeat protein